MTPKRRFIGSARVIEWAAWNGRYGMPGFADCPAYREQPAGDEPDQVDTEYDGPSLRGPWMVVLRSYQRRRRKAYLPAADVGAFGTWAVTKTPAAI